jgi:ferric-dicitrate binding protein FerR (iron transport regulator)
VQVSDDKNVIGIINPNQQITFDTHQWDAAPITVDTNEATAWMEKDIFFDDITLGQAIDQLENRFDLSIDVENERLANCRFTATFVKGEDLRQILTILCEFNSATLKEKTAGGFVIKGGECPL